MASCVNEIVKIKLQSRLNGFATVLECVLTDRITERLPTSPIEREKIHIPRNLKLADLEFYRCSDVDILVGVELFWQLICIGTIKSNQEHPTLQKTHLGWIVAGRMSENVRDVRGCEVRALHTSISDANLQDQLTKFWQVEEDFQPRDAYSPIERFCEQHFRNNTVRNKDGRVMVTLPIREEKIKAIGETREIAMRRFYGLEKRLNRNSVIQAATLLFSRLQLRRARHFLYYKLGARRGIRAA
ncbi:uncharacterized protein LOC118646753 [Monomorium pharaonis]|uniref:uncharacterized protein LOC118646753 n=1 Tax=Monomorium pharaonis TaxID=307658 RepID=UPI00174658A7|nr:uncharacterized protein LOC118646753 [Monomorium pharaonis]